MPKRKENIGMNFGMRKEIQLEILKKFRLMDDDFMAAVFEDIPCTETLLQIILKRDDLTVKEVRPQYEIKNLGGRSVRLDIFALDKNEHAYNIEVQRKDSGAVAKRARYNSSLIDAHMTFPGDDYEALADTYVIFITEHDVLKAGRPIYHIDRTIEETGEKFNDGSHIIYVNSLIQDETELGKLMHDFYCTNPNEMYYKTLADRARYFKESEKGVNNMCELLQELSNNSYNEGWKGGWEGGWEGGMAKGKAEGMAEGKAEGMAEGKAEGARATAWNLSKLGMDPMTIAGAVGYDEETVKKWLEEYKASLS